MKRLLILVFLVGKLCFATEYYVSPTGSNSNDGRSEEQAWKTIAHAASKVRAGDTVWVKAGTYIGENVVFANSGNAQNPIRLIGYKNQPDDIEALYFTYEKGRGLDPSEMPLLDGENRANGEKAITLNKRSYIHIKNIQVKNYRWGVHGGSASFCTLENILAADFGDINTTSQSGYGFQFSTGGNNKFLNSTILNATGANLRVEGDYNLIDGVKSYADDNRTEHISATDYYIHINGGNHNIIRNSHVERVGNLHHTGHGFGLKYDCENNIIENSVSVNVRGAIELRHSGVRNNLVRNVLIKGPEGTITLRDGASNNIIENCQVIDSNEGIRFYDQTEDGEGGLLAFDNIIKNTIFNNVGIVIRATKSSKVSQNGYVSGNQLINCTIDKAGSLFRADLRMDDKNKIINCIFTDVSSRDHKQARHNGEWIIENSNFFEVGFSTPSGTGNMSKEPMFEDAAKKNYRLKQGSPMIDAGMKSEEVKDDMDGNPRPSGSSHDIGAFEYSDGSVGSVEADAGEDQRICRGENVVLTAEGGSEYLWSTGETQQSISVNPSETTLYSVVVSHNGQTDEDAVTVFVESFEASAGQDQTIQQGESVELTATEGDSYLWSTGAQTRSINVSPDETTSYSVEVSSGLCSDTAEVQVKVEQKEVEALELSAGQDQVICPGESIRLTASAGSSFLWSTGERTKSIEVQPQSTTTYQLSAWEGEKEGSAEVTVVVESVKANAGADQYITAGQQVKLTASGGERYQWSTGDTSKTIQFYPQTTQRISVTVFKGDCSDTDEVQIIVTENYSDHTRSTAYAGEDRTICAGESVELTGEGGSTYKWSNGEETKSIAVTPDRTTVYRLEAIKDGISTFDEVQITVQNCAANVFADPLEPELRVYPNPSQGLVNVELDHVEDELVLDVINLNGHVIYSDQIDQLSSSLEKTLDLSGVKRGVYLLRVYNEDENMVHKIVMI